MTGSPKAFKARAEFPANLLIAGVAFLPTRIGDVADDRIDAVNDVRDDFVQAGRGILCHDLVSAPRRGSNRRARSSRLPASAARSAATTSRAIWRACSRNASESWTLVMAWFRRASRCAPPVIGKQDCLSLRGGAGVVPRCCRALPCTRPLAASTQGRGRGAAAARRSA